MLKNLRTFLALAIIALPFSGMANEALENYIHNGGAAKPEKFVQLHVGKLIAVEEAGQIHYMTENGRFVLTGRMIDIWEKKEITQIEQLKGVYDTLNLRKMGLEPEKLNTVTVGDGVKEVSVFVDPTCGPCHEVMNEAIKLSKTEDQYRFNFIVVPALGDHSNLLAKGMFCSTETNERKLDALLKNTIPALVQPEECDTKMYNVMLLGAQSIGVTGVPFLINHDGVAFRGKPSDLKAWLENKQ